MKAFWCQKNYDYTDDSVVEKLRSEDEVTQEMVWTNFYDDVFGA